MWCNAAALMKRTEPQAQPQAQAPQKQQRNAGPQEQPAWCSAAGEGRCQYLSWNKNTAKLVCHFGFLSHGILAPRFDLFQPTRCSGDKKPSELSAGNLNFCIIHRHAVSSSSVSNENTQAFQLYGDETGSSQAGQYPRVGAPVPLGDIFLIPTYFWKFGHQSHFQWSWRGHHLRVSKICSHCFCGQPRMQVTPEDRYGSPHGHRSPLALCCRAFAAAVPGIQAVASPYDSSDVCFQDSSVLLNCHLAPTHNPPSQEKAW